jgi:FHS family L-fucose permease-like MFS transporter
VRGLGRHTKRGASFLVSSVCGGAVGPVILGNVADKIGTRKAMCVPLAFFIIAWSYPLYLNIAKGRELDAYTESHVGTQQGAVDSDSVLAEKDVEARTFETTKV